MNVPLQLVPADDSIEGSGAAPHAPDESRARAFVHGYDGRAEDGGAVATLPAATVSRVRAT